MLNDVLYNLPQASRPPTYWSEMRSCPFEAHRVVGRAVRLTIEHSKDLGQLPSGDWRSIVGKGLNEGTLDTIHRAMDLRQHLGTYKTVGSANPREDDRMIPERTRRVRDLLKQDRRFQSVLEKRGVVLARLVEGR